MGIKHNSLLASLITIVLMEHVWIRTGVVTNRLLVCLSSYRNLVYLSVSLSLSQSTRPRVLVHVCHCKKDQPRIAMHMFPSPSLSLSLSLSVLSALAAPSTRALVSHTNQVVGKLLDSVGGGAGLDVLRVVSDENGLGGLDDDDTLLALSEQATVSAVIFLHRMIPTQGNLSGLSEGLI